MKKKIFTLMTLIVGVVMGAQAAEWPDANYLLLNGSTNKTIAASQVGGTGVTWSCNPDKYSYGNTTCTFYGNSFSKGLKHEGATWTQLVTTDEATFTIVQSLKTNSTGTFLFEDTSDSETKKEIAEWDNVLIKDYSGDNTVDGKTYKDVRVIKIFNLPAGTYKVYRGGASVQSYAVYMGVTYETTPSYTITANMSNGGESSVSGAGSFLRGFSTTLTATPGAGKAFTKWLKDGADFDGNTENPLTVDVTSDATYTAVFADATTYTITVAVNNNEWGSVDMAGANSVAENGSITLTATPASDDYGFVNWTKASDSSTLTDNPLTVSDVTADETYTANFKKYFVVTYDVNDGDKGNHSVALTAEKADINDKFTTPKNQYISKDGYTLIGWRVKDSDPEVVYDPNTEYTLTSDVVLQPVFTANTKTFADVKTSDLSVTWALNKNAGAPSVNLEGSGKNGFLVVQAEIDGVSTDFAMAIDGSAGKANNMNDASRMQVNNGTKFTIPAYPGMTVTINAVSNIAEGGFTVAGENQTSGADTKASVYTYTGSAATIDIVCVTSNYLTSIVAKYPKQKFDFTVAASGISSYCSGSVLDCANFPAGIKAYKVTEVTNTSVKLAEITEPVAAGTGILLIGTGSETYTLPFGITATADVSDNQLIGVNAATEVAAEEGHTLLALSNGKFVKMNDGTVAAHKAYLDVLTSEISGAKALDIIIGGETTGINDASRIMDNAEKDNLIFNLNGQRIATPQKGINIINGKKIIVK